MKTALKFIGLYLLCFAYILGLAAAVVWMRPSYDPETTVAQTDAGEDITAEVMQVWRGQR